MKTTRYLFISAIVLFLSSTYGFSQSKYGEVTMDELEMSTYPNDTTASAVILSKTGETHFVVDHNAVFQFEFSLKVKIKILKNEGLDWCNQTIPYYVLDKQSAEEVIKLAGTAYTLENGKINKTKLARNYIFDESINDRWKVKKFTLSGAKVGSVIEYNYTIKSPFFFELRDFDFQSSIPTIFTSYDITIPEYYVYNVNMQGYERIETDRGPGNMSFSVAYKDNNGQYQSEILHCVAEKMKFRGSTIPALKKEPYILSLNDYRSKVTFELKRIQYPNRRSESYTSTWEKIDEKLVESSSFGGNLKKTGLFKNEITKTEQSIEKAIEIQNLIKSKVKWNEKTAFYPSNLNDALKTGLGNSSDLNFLLINALNAAGFQAYPVMLSTRGHGLLPLTHPTITAFNYVITAVAIDTTLYFTDASAKYGDWNILPEECMVTQARILKGKTSSWKDLSTITTATTVNLGNFEFTDSGMVIKIAETDRGLEAYHSRANYFSYDSQKEYLEKLSAKMNGRINDFNIQNTDDNAKDLKRGYTLVTDWTPNDEFVYINPMFEKCFSTNPFKEETRKFPVTFYSPISYRLISNIKIPQGYVVEELPKSEKFVTPENSLSLTYAIGQNGDVISLTYNFQLKKLLFLQDEYDTLKDFFSKLILKNSEQIVLTKAK
ncbi:DUF3857 domain-containing protein [Viscerimonas tarda]